MMINRKVKRAGSLFLSFLMVTLISCANEERNLQELNYKYDSVSEALARQKILSDSLQRIVENDENSVHSEIYFGKEFEGIEDPEEFIIRNLQQNPEEIPLDPVLGGTMEFRNIEVLSEDWIFAEYDDGHIRGSAIYLYKLQPDGKINFEILLSKQPE